MKLDHLRLDVISAGARGRVARWQGIVALIGPGPGAGPILEACAAAEAAHSPVSLAAGLQDLAGSGSAPSFCVLADLGDRVSVFVHGAVEVRVTQPSGDLEMRGGSVGTWTGGMARDPSSVSVWMREASPGTANADVDLRRGVVPGDALSLSTGMVAGFHDGGAMVPGGTMTGAAMAEPPAPAPPAPAPVAAPPPPAPAPVAPAPAPVAAPPPPPPPAPAPVAPQPAPVAPAPAPVAPQPAPVAPAPAPVAPQPAPVAPQPAPVAPTPTPAPVAPQPAPTPPPAPAPSPAFTPIALHDHDHGHGHDHPPAGPLPVARPAEAAAPAPAAGAADAPADAVQVLGVRCKRGHFNHPDSQYCSVCGIQMVQETLVLVRGARPPLGVLVFDIGLSVPLSKSVVIGRDPFDHDLVRSGEATGVVLNDPALSVSRAHVEVRLKDWDVYLVELGSTNGSALTDADGRALRLLARGEPVLLEPGAHFSVGNRRGSFESSVIQK